MQNINIKLVIIIQCIIGTVLINLIYNTQDFFQMIISIIYFFDLVIINRLLTDNNSSKSINFTKYFSELLFLIYTFLSFMYYTNSVEKLLVLITPAFLLNLYLLFGNNKYNIHVFRYNSQDL